MTDRRKIDWRVPSDEWESFREYVHDKYGTYDGVLGRHAEIAMQEWIDQDDYSEVESMVDRLVEAAGRRPSASSRKKKNSLSEGETTRVLTRVRSTVRDEFQSFAKEFSDDSYGVAFARAVREYRLGGRAARLEDKLDRVVDDAERILSEANDIADSSDELSKVERNTISISERLPEEFHHDQLVEEIHDVAGRGAKASDPTLDRYIARVTQHLGVEPHPEAEQLWVPEEEAERVAGEFVPDVVRKPVYHLDREQRVERLQIELGRDAYATDGYGRVEVGTARADIFGNEVSRDTVVDLMREAAFVEGFETSEDRKISLTVNLTTLEHEGDPYLLEHIVDYYELGDKSDVLLDDPSETRLDDHTPDVSSEWDQMDAAEPAADGGRGKPQNGGGDRS